MANSILNLKMNRLVWITLIVVIGLAIKSFYFSPHPAVGIWEGSGLKDKALVKLSVFNDNTAIYEFGIGKDSCDWSDKSNKLIVLKCDVFGGKANLVITFTVEGSAGEGYLEHGDSVTRMVLVNDNEPINKGANSSKSEVVEDKFIIPPLNEEPSTELDKKEEQTWPIPADNNSGLSQLIAAARERWEKEQNASEKEAILNLINDSTVSDEMKKASLEIYITNGYISKRFKRAGP